MRKYLQSITAILILSSTYVFGQSFPNGNFDQWTGNTLDGWTRQTGVTRSYLNTNATNNPAVKITSNSTTTGELFFYEEATVTAIPTYFLGDFSYTRINQPNNLSTYFNIYVQLNKNGVLFEGSLFNAQSVITYSGSFTINITRVSRDEDVKRVEKGNPDYTKITIVGCEMGCPDANTPNFITELTIDNARFANSITQLGTEATEQPTVLFSPNPTEGIFEVDGDFKMYNLQGELVLEGQNRGNISSFAPGAYLVRVKNKMIKVIKQ